jgi:hypothetical protein
MPLTKLNATLGLTGTLPAVSGENLTGIDGKVKQVITSSINSTGSTTTQIPFDDTIPQNTEGAEIITATITPTSASTKLIISHNASFSQQNYNGYIYALFQDSTADALKSWFRDRNGDSGGQVVDNAHFQYVMTSGTTSATTFKFRGGPCGSYTFYWGDDRGSGRGGGTYEKASMTIIEVE